jgi:hypothetical protein
MMQRVAVRSDQIPHQLRLGMPCPVTGGFCHLYHHIENHPPAKPILIDGVDRLAPSPDRRNIKKE